MASSNDNNEKRQSETDTNFTNYKLEMVLDSGSSLLYLPDPITTYIASLFTPPARYTPFSNTYIVAHDALAPRIGVIIAGTTFFISEDDLLNRGSGAVGGLGIGAQEGECAVTIQGAGEGAIVLGDA